MKSKEIRDYISQLAIEEGLSKEEVELIVSSPFLLAINKMKNVEEYDFPTIYMIKLGTFYVTPWAKEFWKQRNEKDKINL